MPTSMSTTEALGRMLEAARILAGLDQAELGQMAGVSGSTVSNVERGNDARPETVKSIRSALRKNGVSLSLDGRNGLAFVAISFAEPDEDDD
jgi:transcriptional regulator with XRE-family HTH domain